MKNLTRMAILLAAVIGFMSAKPAQANPYHKHHDYYVTHYYKPKPTYYKVYYYYPKKYSTYRVYQPKKYSTYHKVYYYR